jgi:exosortase A
MTTPAPTSSSAMPAYWRMPLAMFVLVVAWLLVLYRDTAIAMVGIWERSDTYAHGFLVPPIVLWLVWRQRHRLAGIVPRPAVSAMLLMLGAVALWLAGDLVAVNAATQLALTMLLVLAVPAVLGWQVAWALLFPLCFMFFAVPIGDFMMPKLMEWTADFTVLALRLSGLPVYREGQQFVIPSGNWSVVEACSGIRYLIASVTVGSLFAYLNYQSTSRRVAFVLVSILVPIAANWARAYIIVMLGHYSGGAIATGVDHLIYGWVFFGVVIVIMFAIGARWSEPDPTDDPLTQRAVMPGTPSRPFRHALLGLVLAITLLPHGVIWAIERAQTDATPELALEGSLQGGWAPGAAPSFGWKPAFEGPSAEMTVGASKDGRPLGMYIGYYRNQDAKRKLVSSVNLLVTHADRDWAQTSDSSGTAEIAGQNVAVRTAELRSAHADSLRAVRLTAWRVYWVNNRFVAGDAMAKIHGALSRLTGQGDDSAVVIVYTPSGEGTNPQATLADFLKANGALITSSLQRTRQP